MSRYSPPFQITPTILHAVAEICERIGRWSVVSTAVSPTLRRNNRIRTIHASLAIENNTLSVAQVTAVLAGKKILGTPREIQEVRNAFAAYEAMKTWSPSSSEVLLVQDKKKTSGNVSGKTSGEILARIRAARHAVA